jgi:homoserine O-acetyltransferase
MANTEQKATQYLKLKTEGKYLLESGESLPEVTLAYETFGRLNYDKSNAILIFHALSGSSHVAGVNKGEGIPYWTEDNMVGWWDSFIGSGKIIDTDKFFVICSNCLGGCYGSTGPSTINPVIGNKYGGKFPQISIGDMAKAQKRLVDELGIKKLFAVIGGSMGGEEALEFSILYPAIVEKVMLIGSCAYTSRLNKVLNFEQIFAIEEDPNFNHGDYYDSKSPEKGLCLARMIAHKTYVDIVKIDERAKNEIVQKEDDLKLYRLKHKIESYMLHQGKKFVKRFDANTYLRILQAMQDFDLRKKYGNGDLVEAFKKLNTNPSIQFLVVTITSDVAFFPEEQEEMVRAFNIAGVRNKYQIVDSDKGHDSFLVETEKYGFIKEFLEN